MNKNEASSYELDSIWKKQPETNLNLFLGAGAIVSTPTDVIKFLEALFRDKIISQASLSEMKLIKEDFGLGIGELPFEDKLSYGHSGHIDGFNSDFGYFPKEKISFVITSNGTVINNNDIALDMVSIIFNFPYEIPKKF